MKKLLLIVTIIIFIILLNFRFYVFNVGYYKEELSKIGVSNEFSEKEITENLNQLVSYIKNNQPLTTSFFNEKEKQHLIDVKNLIDKTIFIFYLSLMLLIIFLYLNKKDLKKPLLYSGISLILIPIFLSLINFNFIFIKFHEIFFTNDLWLLNPETDNLIKLFPKQFFINFTKKILINSLIIGIILVICSFFLKPKSSLKIFSIFHK